jgi:dTDP-4-dehydrorhamnose 3,5-epimerase
MIPGVEVKQLTTHPDSRGFFREIIRDSDPFFAHSFGQVSQSMKVQGYYTPEFHIHRNQTDWWFVPFGLLRAVLCDRRHSQDGEQNFEEYLLGDGQPPVVLKIPPGVAHGLKVIEGPAHLLYITSAEYDPADEGRIVLDYDWLK